MPTKEVAMNKKPTVNVQQGDLFGKMEEKQAKIDKKVDEEIQKETPTMDKIFQDLEFKRLNEKYKETGDKADQKAMDDYVDQWREKNVLKSKEQIDQEAIDAHYEEIQADQARMEAERDYTTMP